MYEPALLVLSFSPILDVAAPFQLAVAAAALFVCTDVAASLLPTVAAAANSGLPTLRTGREHLDESWTVYEMADSVSLVLTVAAAAIRVGLDVAASLTPPVAAGAYPQ